MLLTESLISPIAMVLNWRIWRLKDSEISPITRALSSRISLVILFNDLIVWIKKATYFGTDIKSRLRSRLAVRFFPADWIAVRTSLPFFKNLIDCIKTLIAYIGVVEIQDDSGGVLWYNCSEPWYRHWEVSSLNPYTLHLDYNPVNLSVSKIRREYLTMRHSIRLYIRHFAAKSSNYSLHICAKSFHLYSGNKTTVPALL